MDITREQITAGILAGGEGRRLGGIDKGWYDIAGRPLIEHTLERVRPQAGRVVISANRSLSRYRALGHPVHTDDSDDANGPLAGIAALLRAAQTPYVLIVPVDTPRLPLDLAERLAAAIQPEHDLAVAQAGEQRHVLHALMRRRLVDDVQAAIFAGVRRVGQWQSELSCATVDWGRESSAFANINREEDQQTLR